jgi:hypothetical protein
MLDQQVTCSDLALVSGRAVRSPSFGSDLRRTVVLGHVRLELLGVGSWRWLPS